jgi:thiol peroxidase
VSTLEERTGVTAFRGRPVTLTGPQIRPGDPAPDFTALASDMSAVTFASLPAGVVLLSSVPSLDTDVCSVETRRFDEEAGRLDGLTVLTVSADLPFAQQRWYADSDAKHIQVASDHRDMAFGQAYGVAIKELRLLARAVFVVNADGMVTYVEYVPELSAHPDYDGVLAAVREALG